MERKKKMPPRYKKPVGKLRNEKVAKVTETKNLNHDGLQPEPCKWEITAHTPSHCKNLEQGLAHRGSRRTVTK